MAYPGRQNIYEAVIRRMVQEALEQQELEFRQQHEASGDEILLSYLRDWAMGQHRSPWPGEILGGKLILERFGSWDRALAKAGLPAPRTPNQSRSFARVQEETERQREIYKKRKAEKKALSNERRLRQEAGRKQKE